MGTSVRPRRTRRAHSTGTRPIALHVILYPEDGWILGHNLETDIVSQGESLTEALSRVTEAVTLTFEAASGEKDAASPLESPAPALFWKALKSARLLSSASVTLRGAGKATLLAYRLDDAPGA